MVFFWILTVLMILLGLWFVIPPLLSKNSQAELDHDDLNVSIYRQKLADLDKNEENLTAEELAQVRQEIEQGLLQDVGNDEKPATNSISKKNAAAGHYRSGNTGSPAGLVTLLEPVPQTVHPNG